MNFFRWQKEKKKAAPSPDETNDGADNKGSANEATKPDDNAEKPPERQELVQLNFTTQRGVILLNVDPAMAPNDLRERPLTEAARAIVRSGDGPLPAFDPVLDARARSRLVDARGAELGQAGAGGTRGGGGVSRPASTARRRPWALEVSKAGKPKEKRIDPDEI